MNTFDLQLGGGLIGLWLVGLVALWFLVDRRSRRGPVKNPFVIDGLMLVNILTLLIGGSLVIKGSGLFE